MIKSTMRTHANHLWLVVVPWPMTDNGVVSFRFWDGKWEPWSIDTECSTMVDGLELAFDG